MPTASFPKLRFVIDNGQTLCRPCHTELHKNKPKSVIEHKVDNVVVSRKVVW